MTDIEWGGGEGEGERMVKIGKYITDPKSKEKGEGESGGEDWGR